MSVRDNRQTWLMVCPGVSSTSSSTVLPTLITSPRASPRFTPPMRFAPRACAITLAPVAATTPALPAV